MMRNKIERYYHTLKYLRPIQFYYRMYYFMRKKIQRLIKYRYPLFFKAERTFPVRFVENIAYPLSYQAGNFTFLNLSHRFKAEIDWNYPDYGKLWTYNLTYFDYLRQEEMDRQEGLYLIGSFIDALPGVKDGLMPFPTSLRGINWVLFLSRYRIDDEKINDSLYAQYRRLMKNIEYHILGNHLLENGFSLLFGAYYFRDGQLYRKAEEILEKELNEQILADGAHFELSPMYHQIMLLRVLDSVNLLENNKWQDDKLLTLLKEKASKMLGWLQQMTYKNGAIPLFNDSTNGIAPATDELLRYAEKLDIVPEYAPLSSSGYRKIEKNTYECVIDIGDIGPDYIPGHAHSDTFNFELYVKGKPVIVDTGLSTYESNARRTNERSTSAHNTVVINGEEQSHVWGGFRVAERAKVIDINEREDMIAATHDGYQKNMGLLHTRQWNFSDESIIVSDRIDGDNPRNIVSYLHFHPDIPVEIKNHMIVTPLIEISYYNIRELTLLEYEYAPMFNRRTVAPMVKALIEPNSRMEIKIL